MMIRARIRTFLAALGVALLAAGALAAPRPGSGQAPRPGSGQAARLQTARPADAGWEPLFDGKTLTSWQPSKFSAEGAVKVEEGRIVLDTGKSMTGITWAGATLPTTNYEIALQAMRVEGRDFFAGVTFPVDGSFCSLILGGWGGSVVGLSSINGQDASENDTSQSIEFQNGRWYSVRIRVTPMKIEAWLDDRQIITKDLKGNKVDIRFEMDLSKPLGVASWKTKSALRDIRLRRLSTPAPVRPGVEVFLSDVPAALRGKRVGLITNQSAIDRSRTSVIDLIAAHKDLKLTALLAPEHGIRGTVAAGEKIEDDTDPKTGIRIHSLYRSEDHGPTPEMLKDVDVLVYDLQEVGGRTWTYVSTMILSMQAAAKKQIPFVVLDRPNPIGGEIVEGALLDPKFKSFVGMYPIPARHGMTVGELATMFNTQHGIGAALIVARVENWRRSQGLDETGLPWTNPSPNLRSLGALQSYPGSVYFEGTNLTEGRGTDRPFEQVGAPWLNAPEVARIMNDKQLSGIRLEAITMPVEPTAAKFKGQTIPGIRFAITDHRAYRPVRTALILIDEIRRQHPRDFAWGPSIDRLTGSDKVRLAINAGRLAALLDEWDSEAALFLESRKPFLLYR